jgi:hypothetical protein
MTSSRFQHLLVMDDTGLRAVHISDACRAAHR